MREWTEQHIRELVRRHIGEGKGELETALLLRLWITNIETEPIEILNGSGRITFQIRYPTISEGLQQYGRTRVLVEFEGLDFSDNVHSFFMAESQAHHRAELTLNTILGAPDFWRNVIQAMFYHATHYNTFWMNSKADSVYCDEQPIEGVRYNITDRKVYDNPDRNNVSYSGVLGDVWFTGVPAGTKKVSMFFTI